MPRRLTNAEVARAILAAAPEDVDAARGLMSTWTAEQVRRFAETGEEPDDGDEADAERGAEE